MNGQQQTLKINHWTHKGELWRGMIFPFVNPRPYSILIKKYLISEAGWSPTHHSDGEVVVYNTVRHRVPSLILVCGCDINFPAIQHHLRTVLDVPHYLQEALTLIASGKNKHMMCVKTGLESLCYLADAFKGFRVTCVQTSSEFFLVYWFIGLILANHCF